LLGACVIAGIAILFVLRLRWVRKDAEERLALANREARSQMETERARLELDLEKRRLELERETSRLQSSLVQKEEEALSTLMGAEKEREALRQQQSACDEAAQRLESRENELSSLIRYYRT